MGLPSQLSQKCKKTIEIFKQEISQLRTGRASPALVENIVIEAYDTKLTLKEVATITAPQPRLLQIDPWDKQLLPVIERAIQTSDLNLNPQVQGKIITIALPPLDDEQRQKLVRLLKQKKEHARQAIRNLRDEAIKKIRIKKQEGEISEDQYFREQDEIQKEIDEFMEEIENIAGKKEKEILTI